MISRLVAPRALACLLASCCCLSSGWAQTVAPKPRVGFLAGETVEVAVADGRPTGEDFATVSAAIMQALRKAYPDATIITKADTDYYRESKAGVITIKIQVLGYGRGFGLEASGVIATTVSGSTALSMALPKGKWNGVSVFSVSVFDKRKERDMKETTVISRVVSKDNTWGHKSGNQAKDQAFSEAVNELLIFIDRLFLS